jgi:hypothetical protein
VPIGSLELRVRENEALHVVLPGRQVGERSERKSRYCAIEADRFSGHERFDIHPEERLARARRTGLEAWLATVGSCDEDERTTRDGPACTLLGNESAMDCAAEDDGAIVPTAKRAAATVRSGERNGRYDGRDKGIRVDSRKVRKVRSDRWAELRQ